MRYRRQLAAGLVIVAIGCYAIYAAINWFAYVIQEIDPGIGAAIVAGATTVLTSVAIASYNARKARERIAVEANRDKKAQAYMSFMDTLIEVIRNANEDKDKKSDHLNELEEFFYKFTSTVAVYGGPDVARAFGEWRSSAGEVEPVEMMARIDDLIRAMRSDLGESNQGIERNELLGLFIIGGKDELSKNLVATERQNEASD